MADPGLVSHRPAKEIEYPSFLKMMYEHASDYLEPSLLLLGIDQAEFEYLFRTRGSVHAILKGDQVAGFYWTEVRDGTCHIHALFVDPKFQKQGIARRVLADIENDASSDIARLEMGVHRDNCRAREIYEKAGYKVGRELDELDFIVMRKTVD